MVLSDSDSRSLRAWIVKIKVVLESDAVRLSVAAPQLLRFPRCSRTQHHIACVSPSSYVRNMSNRYQKALGSQGEATRSRDGSFEKERKRSRSWQWSTAIFVSTIWRSGFACLLKTKSLCAMALSDIALLLSWLFLIGRPFVVRSSTQHTSSKSWYTSPSRMYRTMICKEKKKHVCAVGIVQKWTVSKSPGLKCSWLSLLWTLFNFARASRSKRDTVFNFSVRDVPSRTTQSSNLRNKISDRWKLKKCPKTTNKLKIVVKIFTSLANKAQNIPSEEKPREMFCAVHGKANHKFSASQPDNNKTEHLQQLNMVWWYDMELVPCFRPWLGLTMLYVIQWALNTPEQEYFNSVKSNDRVNCSRSVKRPKYIEPGYEIIWHDIHHSICLSICARATRAEQTQNQIASLTDVKIQRRYFLKRVRHTPSARLDQPKKQI